MSSPVKGGKNKKPGVHGISKYLLWSNSTPESSAFGQYKSGSEETGSNMAASTTSITSSVSLGKVNSGQVDETVTNIDFKKYKMVFRINWPRKWVRWNEYQGCVVIYWCIVNWYAEVGALEKELHELQLQCKKMALVKQIEKCREKLWSPNRWYPSHPSAEYTGSARSSSWTAYTNKGMNKTILWYLCYNKLYMYVTLR